MILRQALEQVRHEKIFVYRDTAQRQQLHPRVVGMPRETEYQRYLRTYGEPPKKDETPEPLPF